MAFDENMKIWMDGEFKELKDANISILAQYTTEAQYLRELDVITPLTDLQSSV